MSLKPMPELSSLLSDDEWLAMWHLAVQTRSPDEERWAFEKLKLSYRRKMGELPIDPEHNLPTGMWEAMLQTAERFGSQRTS